MKILLLGDTGNYHATLAKGLRDAGHTVVLATDDPSVDADVKLPHGKGFFAEMLFVHRAKKLKGYDVVQLATPQFLSLAPAKLKKMLEQLKESNGAVFLTSIGEDSAIAANLSSKKPLLAYSHLHGAGPHPWAETKEARNLLRPANVKLAKEIYNSVDGIVAANYENYKVIAATMPDVPLAYGGVPVVTADYASCKAPDFGGVIECAVEAVAKSGDRRGLYAFETMMQIVEVQTDGRAKCVRLPRVTPDELPSAQIVAEDIHTYSPCSLALAAMASGIVPVSGGEEEFYEFIGEDKLRPIININTNHFKDSLHSFAKLLVEPERLARMSAEGREFVRKHNDVAVVTKRFLDFWQAKRR